MNQEQKLKLITNIQKCSSWKEGRDREPLAIMTRSRPCIEGFPRQLEEDRIALFADDVLFFLGDVETSLNPVMQMVVEFGRFSGLVINWDKSALLPIDPLGDQMLPKMVGKAMMSISFLDPIDMLSKPYTQLSGGSPHMWD